MKAITYEIYARHEGQAEFCCIASDIDDRDTALTMAHDHFDDEAQCEAVNVWAIMPGLFGDNPTRIMSRSVPW